MLQRRVLDTLRNRPVVMGRDSVLVGSLSGNEDYLVHGEVYGDCDLYGVLMLATDCYWQGNILADVVIVRGTVMGDITARLKLELRSSAQVTGNVSAPVIALAQEAQLRGSVAEEALVTRFSERRQFAAP